MTTVVSISLQEVAPTAYGGERAVLFAPDKLLQLNSFTPSIYAYDTVEGTLTQTGTNSVLSSRNYSTAAMLPDGRVFHAGGYDNDGVLDDAAIGDISETTITWVASTSLPAVGYGQASLLLADDRIAILGGGTTDYYPSAAVNFGTVSGDAVTWAAGTPLPEPMTYPGAVQLADGRILVMGYVDSTPNIAYLGTISGDSVSWVTATISGGTYSPWEDGFTLTRLSDGSVLVTGGQYYDATLEDYVQETKLGIATVTGTDITIEMFGEIAATGNPTVSAGLMSDDKVVLLSGAGAYIATLEVAAGAPVVLVGNYTSSSAGAPSAGYALPVSGNSVTCSGSAPGIDGVFTAQLIGCVVTATSAVALESEGAHLALLAGGSVVSSTEGAITPEVSPFNVFGGIYLQSSATTTYGGERAVLFAPGRLIQLNFFTPSIYDYDATSETITKTVVTKYLATREFSTSARLSDGGILHAGGYFNGVVYGDAAIGTVSGTTIAWAAATALPAPGFGQAAVSLADGRTLLLGGSDAGFAFTANVIFGTMSEAGMVWSAGTSLPEAMGYPGAVQLADGRVLIMGAGDTTSKVAYLGTISGDTISWVAATLQSGYADWETNFTLTRLPGTALLVTGGRYYNWDLSAYVADNRIGIASVSDNTVSIEMVGTFATAPTNGIVSAAAVQQNRIVILSQSWAYVAYLIGKPGIPYALTGSGVSANQGNMAPGYVLGVQGNPVDAITATAMLPSVGFLLGGNQVFTAAGTLYRDFSSALVGTYATVSAPGVLGGGLYVAELLGSSAETAGALTLSCGRGVALAGRAITATEGIPGTSGGKLAKLIGRSVVATARPTGVIGVRTAALQGATPVTAKAGRLGVIATPRKASVVGGLVGHAFGGIIGNGVGGLRQAFSIVDRTRERKSLFNIWNQNKVDK